MVGAAASAPRLHTLTGTGRLASRRRCSRGRQPLFPLLLRLRRRRRPGRAALPFRFREPERRGRRGGCAPARAPEPPAAAVSARLPGAAMGAAEGRKSRNRAAGGRRCAAARGRVRRGPAVTGTLVPDAPRRLRPPALPPSQLCPGRPSLSPHPHRPALWGTAEGPSREDCKYPSSFRDNGQQASVFR